MVKRHLGEGGGVGVGVDDSEFHTREIKRRLSAKCVLKNVLSGISLHELENILEPMLRRVVREEVNCAIQRLYPSSTRSSANQIESSGASACQLFFCSKLPSTLFTSSKVQSEDCEPVKIVLVDTNSKQIITSGPMSSIKIDIVVLNGDFVAGDGEEWTKNDFDACVIREREGKRPLLNGDLTLTLRNGVADLRNICFTDNSSWIRSRKFRLGARVRGISTDIRVKEAKSEAFVVKDHRGESYKKHRQPSLTDEVWRLDRIAKDGAFHTRLAAAGILTVKDFLRLYVTNPSLLRNILGGGISNRTWETITGHAINCTLDDKMYLYLGAAERLVLVFNSIWKAIGAIFDGQNFQNLDKLNQYQMRLVEDVKQQAYRNSHEIVLFTEESFIGPPMLLSCLQAEVLNSHAVGQHNVNTLVASEGIQAVQDQLPRLLNFDHATTSSTYTFEVDTGSLPEVLLAHDYSSPTKNSILTKNFCYGSYNEGYSAGPSSSLGSVLTNANFLYDDICQGEMATLQEDGYFLSPNNQSVDFFPSNLGFRVSRNGRSRARWFKLRAALKWGISIRRDAAAKRLARLLYYNV